MKPAPKTPHEAERLKALNEHQLMDTLPEQVLMTSRALRPRFAALP
ncbi:hypothetical protein ADICEAN_02285 [Cesiribacter andamanensis AMV16]|uniref:Uncharacterized protein n=1 Tax=Cesiribacter andamanensis AMV16 TaxID=1279009 RepID=M7NVS8_9BACT|nr:hypothetical protein ADICEAN_02285 [Cesiribacter andamanensis AMV16]